jgi:hypothetical protein
MPQRKQGPRLWPQPAHYDRDGKLKINAVWVIRDGAVKRSTGVLVSDPRQAPPEAEQALRDYLQTKHAPPRDGYRPLSAIPIADVLNIYARDKVAGQARPHEVAQRLAALSEWWGDRKLAEVTGETCRAYVARGGTRRQLEDLRAAIQYHEKEGLHREVVRVTLPEKGVARERWLTRSEAARLIWAAYNYHEMQKGWPTDRRTRRHVARFVLISLYTGTRAGAICAASFTPTEGRGWINLDTGIFYRRPAGERETNKRKAPVRLPDRLLAHLRRWKRLGICQDHPVEWRGGPVRDVDKAFRHSRIAAGLSDDVTPHVLKHTAVTWSIQAGTSAEEAASFFATTVETIQRHYWHHSPDYQRDTAKRIGRGARQFADRLTGNEREQTRPNANKVIALRS